MIALFICGIIALSMAIVWFIGGKVFGKLVGYILNHTEWSWDEDNLPPLDEEL